MYVVSSDTLTLYNITELNHITNYTVSVAAINCAGTGDSTVYVGHNISKLTLQLDILHFKCIDTCYSCVSMYMYKISLQ